MQTAAPAFVVAIAYPDLKTAERVRATLAEMHRAKLVAIEDMAVVTRSNRGDVDLRQGTGAGGRGAADGGVWGSILGRSFLPAFLATMVGKVAGRAAAVDVGIDDDFLRVLGTRLDDGAAAVVVLARGTEPKRLVAAIAGYGGWVLKTSLDRDWTGRLEHALETRSAG